MYERLEAAQRKARRIGTSIHARGHDAGQRE
jgi:hypothetical protein